MADVKMKRIYKEVTMLKLLDTNTANPRFRLQQSPFSGDDDDEDASASKIQEEYVIIGQIFPNSKIFNERSYSIEIKLTKTFPFDGPEVRFLTPIYHPNIGKDGKFCTALLLKDAKWSPTATLTQIVKAAVDHVDNPDVDYSVSVELGKEYQDNRAEFNRKALEYVIKHGLPR